MESQAPEAQQEAYQDRLKKYEREPFYDIIRADAFGSIDLSDYLDGFSAALNAMQEVRHRAAYGSDSVGYKEFQAIAEKKFLEFFKSFCKYHSINAGREVMQIPERSSVSVLLGTDKMFSEIRFIFTFQM